MRCSGCVTSRAAHQVVEELGLFIGLLDIDVQVPLALEDNEVVSLG